MRNVLIAGVIITLAVLFILFDHQPRVDVWRTSDTAAQQLTVGRSLYQIHCAVCHGRNLEGQPNWKQRMSNGHVPAPPHDASGHTWHHPDDVLIGVTKYGLKPYAGEDYESDMPAFGGTLSDQEIGTIIDYVKSTWPERERGYQSRMTSPRKTTQ